MKDFKIFLGFMIEIWLWVLFGIFNYFDVKVPTVFYFITVIVSFFILIYIMNTKPDVTIVLEEDDVVYNKIDEKI